MSIKKTIGITALIFAPALSLAEVPSAYKNAALKIGVPEKILFAVALTESKLHLGSIGLKPWPWTLNVRGKAYRFKNSQETLTEIIAQQTNGTKSIDVGLMQVNLHYHGHRFESLEDSVNPYTNIEVAARILKEEYINCKKEWWCAVGRYHSYRKGHAERYRNKVREEWANI